MDIVLALAAAEDFYSTKKLCTLHHVSLILSTRGFAATRSTCLKCEVFSFWAAAASSSSSSYSWVLFFFFFIFFFTVEVMCLLRKKKKQDFFFLFFFFFFFFQSCYKGNSLHDRKLKNTQECTAQMLTSKPMYKESKCMWGCITWCRSCTAFKPCVCVYVLPRPKAGSKTSFGAARSFLPPKLRNSELYSL
jgi:hypothetical protein